MRLMYRNKVCKFAGESLPLNRSVKKNIQSHIACSHTSVRYIGLLLYFRGFKILNRYLVSALNFFIRLFVFYFGFFVVCLFVFFTFSMSQQTLRTNSSITQSANSLLQQLISCSQQAHKNSSIPSRLLTLKQANSEGETANDIFLFWLFRELE